MKLSASDLVQLASAAGFRGSDLATASAVALAESGGDPNAYNPEGSVGLWQIYLPAHPEFFGAALTDPAVNASKAFLVYAAAGFSFRPWTTYRTGAYTRYLPGSRAAADALMNAVEIAPGITVLPPAEDAGANTSAAIATASGAQIQQLPGWVLAMAAAVGVVIFLQD